MQPFAGYKSCAKCKTKRQAYVTDKDPSTLVKYKTCDLCRKKNKRYKRKQKLRSRLQQKALRNDKYRKCTNERQLRNYMYVGDSTFSEAEPYEPIVENGPSTISLDSLDIPTESAILTLDEFLYRISRNDERDVRDLHISATVPEYIIERVPRNRQEPGSGAVTNDIKLYREEVKAKLKVHYLNRIFEVLKQAGYTFKTRSTNWKNSKFYSQMLCSCDVGSKKRALSVFFGESPKSGSCRAASLSLSSSNSSELSQRRGSFSKFSSRLDSKSAGPETRSKSASASVSSQAFFSTPLYPCHSHFNYSFDSTSGWLHMDFAHLSHSHLESAVPGASGSIVKSWIKDMDSSHYQVSDSESEEDTVVAEDECDEQESISSTEIDDADNSGTTAYSDVPGFFSRPEYDSLSEGSSYLWQVIVETTGDAISLSSLKRTGNKPMTPFASALDTLHKSICSRTMN